MAFNKITDVLDVHQQRADEPIESATVLKQLYDQDVNTVKTRHNEFIDALESTTDGNSGMDNIGMTPINGVMITPQQSLEYLKERVDATAPTLNIYSVLDNGLVGDGVTNDATALNDLITSIGSTDATILFPKPTAEYLISTNVAFPSNINIEFLNGAMLKVSNTISVTGTNTKLTAGLWQIFDLSLGGTIDGSWNIVETYPNWFGAINDGVNDDTIYINNAIDYANDNGVKAVMVGSFYITDTIVIKCDLDASLASFVYNGSGIAVKVHTGNIDDDVTNKVIRLPEVIQQNKVVGVFTGTGVQCSNMIECRVFVKRIFGFENGLHITGEGRGNSYNEYYLGKLDTNKINLLLEPLDETGYVTENTFYSGRLRYESNEGTGVSGTRQLAIINFSATSFVSNNNVFIKPSLEGDTAEYMLECEGTDNLIISARWEGSTPNVLYNSVRDGSGQGNVIMYGRNSRNINFSFTGVEPSKNVLMAYQEGEEKTLSDCIKYGNIGSSALDIIQLYASGVEVAGQDSTSGEWSIAMSANKVQGKRQENEYSRIVVDFQNSKILFGSGTSEPIINLGRYGSDLGLQDADFILPNSDYSKDRIILGTNYLWVDATGVLRIKDGAPTSDTDGIVVGSQT